jgi:hypothetical protein
MDVIKQPKGKPVPVRFSATETHFLSEAAQTTGLCQAELVRRAVRLLKRQHQHSAGFGFVLELAA